MTDKPSPKLDAPVYDPSADPSFGGRLTWDIAPITLKAEFYSQRSAKALLEQGEISAEWVDTAEEFFLFLYLTRSVQYKAVDGDHPAFGALANLIKVKAQLSSAEAWAVRTELPYQLVTAWRAAYIQAQYAWANPAELPTYALTAAQKDEANQPNSPLAKAEKRTGGN